MKYYILIVIIVRVEDAIIWPMSYETYFSFVYATATVEEFIGLSSCIIGTMYIIDTLYTIFIPLNQ